jgi:hypothetical protein
MRCGDLTEMLLCQVIRLVQERICGLALQGNVDQAVTLLKQLLCQAVWLVQERICGLASQGNVAQAVTLLTSMLEAVTSSPSRYTNNYAQGFSRHSGRR